MDDGIRGRISPPEISPVDSDSVPLLSLSDAEREFFFESLERLVLYEGVPQ
jgi:hypothetical protein